ncbi:MAG: hypothetical protein R3C44_13690 [Chloroflexota bacterium]
MTVGLVSDQPDIRREALALGLPAFPDIRTAERQKRTWNTAGRREQIGFAYGASRQPPDVA